MPVNEKLTSEINQLIPLQLPPTLTEEAVTAQLATYINHLITSNFQQLVQLLYRVDVNEMQLKKLLKQQPQTDAGLLIAQLIIKRQLQKIKWRKESDKNNTADGEEKWQES